MSDKAFASLSSGLLARKGQARPAMRPQLVEDDLGWNDMGAGRHPGLRLPADLAGAPPEPTPVARQQEEIARAFEPAEEPPAHLRLPKPRADGRRVAFTLRLDPERHLRLRVGAALTGRSAQRLLVEAFDQWLGTHDDVERLVETLPGADRSRGET